MHPELIFLGTAGDCVSIGRRSGAGLLLKTERTLLHIDPGPGALVDLVRAGHDPRKISAILVSKVSFERSHDVPALKWAATLNNLQSKDIVLLPTDDWHLKEFNDVKIEKIPLESSAAFLFRLPDTKILYTPELTSALPESDILVLAGKPIKKHIQKLKPTLLILTHFGEDVLKKSPIYLARELSDENTKVISAEDGLSVSPMDYSASSKQKSLDKFSKPAN
ncbi:hypothetical protein KY329_04710 [Candidatus Woesearchaeota archaeon]|nr:hypothetical protein [Candidatus Woesearchaeota archaeon]